MQPRLGALVPLSLLLASLGSQGTPTIPIEDGARLQPVNVTLAPAMYHGRRAIRVVEGAYSTRALGEAIAVVNGVTFQEGTIEVDVAGAPSPQAAARDRGFIGLAFHLAPGAERFKTFYLRPTNARADDQLRRNHTTQYTALPDWPWDRLRREQPGQYESYTDMEAGEWTSIKIVVAGTRAILYINGSAQPALVVTDLKDPVTSGGLALWIGEGTEGYFANLRVTPQTP
jgi:hypothetical protein